MNPSLAPAIDMTITGTGEPEPQPAQKRIRPAPLGRSGIRRKVQGVTGAAIQQQRAKNPAPGDGTQAEKQN